MKTNPPKLKVAADQKQYRTFEDLEAYQVAREFRKKMYAVNRKLPSIEKFELGSQIRRAAVSLTNNIAEGHGRYHYLEQLKFCLNARGSLEELLDDLNVSDDESYIPSTEVGLLKDNGWRVHRVLNGYMRWLGDRKQGELLKAHDQSPAYAAEIEDAGELHLVPTARRASTLQWFNESR